jgi:hypothetical protein
MGYQLSLCPELVKMSWDDIVEELESEAKLVGNHKDLARTLKSRVEDAISRADSSAGDDILNRLDLLLISLTEASRESACTNAKCPHYGKKCKMR